MPSSFRALSMAAVAALASSLSACSGAPETDEPALTLDATLSGTVIDENLDAVSGVTICVDARPEIPCTKSDALGQYDLGVPSNQRLLLRYEKKGFVPKLWSVDSGGSGFFTFWVMQHRAWYQAQAAAFGVSRDPSRGMMSFQVLGYAGISYALEPASGDGPFYLGSDLAADPQLRSTSSSGVGVFLNLPPGSFRPSLQRAGSTCAIHAGYGADPIEDVPVRAGTMTYVSASCEGPVPSRTARATRRPSAPGEITAPLAELAPPGNPGSSF
jgi:hypothetical protein